MRGLQKLLSCIRKCHNRDSTFCFVGDCSIQMYCLKKEEHYHWPSYSLTFFMYMSNTEQLRRFFFYVWKSQTATQQERRHTDVSKSYAHACRMIEVHLFVVLHNITRPYGPQPYYVVKSKCLHKTKKYMSGIQKTSDGKNQQGHFVARSSIGNYFFCCHQLTIMNHGQWHAKTVLIPVELFLQVGKFLQGCQLMTYSNERNFLHGFQLLDAFSVLGKHMF